MVRSSVHPITRREQASKITANNLPPAVDQSAPGVDGSSSFQGLIGLSPWQSYHHHTGSEPFRYSLERFMWQLAAIPELAVLVDDFVGQCNIHEP